MGIFTVFMILWCTGAVFFPIMSIASSEDPVFAEEGSEKKVVPGSQTIFLDDLNRKELFSLEGNYSDQQIIEHDGKTYLVYFDKAENNTIYMCIKAVLDVNGN